MLFLKQLQTIEAIADIRSAIKDINGYDINGQKLIVEPILNTSITYDPKRVRPVPNPTSSSAPSTYQQKFSSVPPRKQRSRQGPFPPMYHNNASPMYGPPRMRGGGGGFYQNNNNNYGMGGYNNNDYDYYPEQERVLRDPYDNYGPPPRRPIHHPPFPNAFVPRPLMPRHYAPRPPQMRPPRYNSNVAIEPLFFKRNEYTKGGQHQQQNLSSNNSNNESSFYEDIDLNSFDGPPIPVAPSSIHHHQQQTIPFKRFASSQPEEGEPFQVPGMIGIGEFKPPRKYFANHPNRPKKKKKKGEPKPQPPIPEEIQKPVPDFSSYYNVVPDGSVLKPFPPPANP